MKKYIITNLEKGAANITADQVLEIGGGGGSGGGGASYPIVGNDGDLLQKDATLPDGVKWVDSSSLGKNISNTNLVWSADRSQNLGGYKLSFTNGRFSVSALELEVKVSNSISNTIWSDGVKVKHTNNLGITSDIGNNIGNSNVTTVGTYTYTQAHAWTHNTGGFNYKLQGLPNAVNIANVIVRDVDDIMKSATVIELSADNSTTSEITKVNLDLTYPTAVAPFEVICQNAVSTKYPNGVIYKRTATDWKGIKLENV